MTEEQRNAIRQRLEGMNGNIQPEYQPREPEENDKGILDTMIDGVKDAAEWVADSAVGQFVKNAATEAYEDTRDVLMAKSWDEAHEAYNRHDLTANINAVANDNNSFFQPVAQAIQQSSTAADYFFSETGKLSQARTVEQELGIPVAVTMADSESWKKANAMYQENLEYKKLAEENGQQWSIDDFYSRYPVVKEVAEADPAAGALILKDAPKIRRELDIIDGFSQYLSMGNKRLELNNLRFKSHGGNLSENDKQRMQDLEKQLDIEQKLYDVKFRDNPILYALSTVGQSLPEMGQSIYAGMEDAGAWWAAGTWAGAGVGSALGPGGAAAGAVAGGAAGGIIGTVKGVAKAVATSEARREVLRQVAMKGAAKATAPQLLSIGAQFGGWRGLAVPETGVRYDEYKNLRDANGNPLLSDDEAWRLAVIGGSANAALEVVPTFGVLGKLAMPGKQSARVFEDIIAGHTAKTQLASHMGDSFRKFMGGTLKVGATESFEEATQQISDDIIMNNIKNANGGRAYSEKYGVLYDEGKALTAKEILGNAIDAAVVAIPSSLIFGMAGSIGSGAASTGRYAARQRHLSQIEANNGAMARHTYTGTIMAQELQEAVHDSDLQQTAPDVQKKLIHDKAAGTGFEVMYIDTEMAMQKENGKEDLAQVAKAAGIDEEALQTAVETKGTLAVPLECFAQSEASSEILDAASFNVEADSMARMRENAKHTLETMKANAEKLVEQQINLVKTIPQELYPEDTQEAQVYRDLVEAAIVTDMENPARGLKQLIQQAEAEKLAILQPALNFLNDTHGQGVSIIDTGDGRGVRVSENAKWYQDFYREHKRKPTKQELMDIASDMVSGKSNIEYFTVTDEHMAAEADKVSADLSAVNDRLEALNSVKDKVQQINSTEMKIAESMSPEAYKVYRNYMTMLGNAPGTASRAARVNAVLLAHMAERLAENIRRATGNQEYTAVDAAKKIELQLGGTYNSGSNMNQAMFDVSKVGVSSLKEFADKVKEVESEGKAPSKVMWVDNSTGVVYPGAQLKHAITKHELTEDDLANIQSGINKLTDVYKSKQHEGMFHGQPIFGKCYTNGELYFVCLEMRSGGEAVFLTASKTNESLFETYKKEHGSERLCSQGEPVPDSNHALSIPNIQELLGIVKNGNTLNQMAGEHAKTAALDKLEQAKAMAEDSSSEEIYKATGWFKGQDGKMAIPANATVKASVQNTLHGDEQEVQRQIRAKEELLNSEPVVEITENILAGKDKAELKKYFREMYQHTEAGAKYPQPTVVYTKYGEPVCITVNGTYKEMVRHSADKRVIMLMPYLKQILENSTLMFSEKPLTGRIKKLNSVTNGYSHYACKVSIDGENVLVRAVIRRSTNGDYCYDINIDNYQQEKKDSSQPGWPDHNSGAVMKNPSKSASIISDWIGKVNSHNLSILSGNGGSVKKNEIFNQEIKGQTGTTANGQYIVSLFEKADESTFMHEMAHVYLLELEKLAELDDQCRADLNTIMEWANYHEGDEKKFKGSPFAKEFRQMANNMLAAEQAGDYDTVNKIRRQWAHERFARGFEMYLQHGTAPSRGLQSVFRRFKQFLSAIYIAFTGEGVRANAKVERVMARMLASDEEIEAMALDDRYKDIAKAGGEKLLNETQQETYARWYQEAKEEAKEKLMKVMMKDLDEEHQRKYQEALEHEREETRKNLEALPLYIAQKVAKETGNDNAVVEIGLYPTVEAYHAELAEYGSLEDTLENYMKEFAEEMDKKILQEHVSEEQLSKMMEQTVYHKKLMAFEAEALREKEKAANKINAKAKEAMDQVNAAVNNLPDDIDITAEKDNKEVKKLLQAINKLRFSTRWTAKELGDIEGLAKQATKADVEKALKEFSKEATAWKRNLKTLEEAFKGRMQIIKKTTRSMLHNQPISESCDYGRYVASEKRAAEMMHKMVRAGRWDVAMIQQEARFTSAALAEAAEKNREKVNKILAKVAKQLTAKSVRIPVEHRYWIQKIAFDMKLDKNWQKDIGRPTSENGRIVRKEPVRPEDCRQLAEIFAELKNSLDVQEDMLGALDVIYQPGFTDYRALTAKQFEACIDIISVLYKTGKNKFQLKSFDGKLISDVLNDIRLDINEQGDVINLPHVIQNKVNDNIGGLGYNDYFAKIPGIGPTLSQYGSKYLVAHMKPEEMIRLLGPVAHKYLYGLYDRAAGENGRRTAEATQKLQEIMSVYSRKEKQNFSKQQYKLRIGKKEETFSKENIICMALNMGNDVNFIRLYKGLDVMGNVLQGFVERNMTKKDWEVVQAIWDLIGSYWPETVKVEEELNGVTLERVKPTPFTVMCDGQPIKMRGGYYPIAYNPMKSPKAEQQAMDAVTQRNMSGAQVLGTGRGFTKSRSDTQNIERPLLLQFNVIPTHLQNVIQNITFRIAARDAYRLTHSQGFEDLVRGTLGDDALRAIDQWVVDCWRTMPTDNDLGSSIFSSAIGFLRRNAAINIMGWRWWPVIENVTNIFPMMDCIGAAETVTAIGDYMKHRKENDKLLLKSIFMTNRINSMDRDIGATPGIFKAGYVTTDWLKEHAYTALAFTDLMFSKPLWCKAYKDNFASRYQEVLREEKEAKADLEAAQEAVKEYRIQISESNKEIYILQQRLTEGSPYEQEAGPGTVQEINEIRKRIAELQIELEPLKKSLFKATCEVERLSERPFKSQSDIIKEAEHRAIQDADAVVRNVFGSGQTKDLASVQKGGEFLKLFTAFYSFFSTQMNAILAAYYKGKFAKQDIAGGQNYKRWMPFAKAVFYRIVLTSAMATLLKMVILGDGNDDDHKYRKVKDDEGNDIKEEIPLIERFFVQLAKNTVSTASGSFVGLRDIVSLYNNLVFEGTDFGRGASIGSISVGVIDKLTNTFKLVTQQEEKNARIDEQEAKRQAKYDKMTPEAKKKFDEKRQYMKPAHRITWADIAKGVAQTVTAASAAKTGITDTMANAVGTTLQYMADGDGRYDKTLSNIVWSAIWNKKPVEREIPQEPVKPKKKKKGADKK